MSEQLCVVLEGLNCPHCAGKIEDSVQRLEYVISASLSLATQEMRVEFGGADKGRIIEDIRGIANALEPDVNVHEKSDGRASGGAKLAKESILRLVRLGTGLLIYAAALAFPFPPQVKLILFIAAYLMLGIDVVVKALRNIAAGDFFDENFLMSISTIGAFCVNQYPEAVAVMIFYQAGEFFQGLAVDRSRRSIKELMSLKPEEANVWTESGVISKKPEDVAVGDVIVVKPGEKVPLDGVAIEGSTLLDLSSLLGESAPFSLDEGEEVLSGAVNLTGLIKVRVTKTDKESTVSKILEMVEKASAKKAPTEKFITKFSKVYTPAVVFLAAAIALVPPLLLGGGFSEWISRALVFLVVSCPCALIVSVPLSFFSGIGACSKKGILIKGGNHLQALAEIDTVVFDKTGTLTKGLFKVTKAAPEAPYSEDYLLEQAYLAESNSIHPIAKSIAQALKARGGGFGDVRIDEFREISGKGVEAVAGGRRIIAGSASWMEENGYLPAKDDSFGTLVHVAADGEYIGHLVISDEMKKDSAEAVRELKRLGIGNIAMLTGDRSEAAKKASEQLGIEKAYSELLPHEKVEKLESIYAESPGAKVLFAGDGINDAPILAMANVGCAMGGVGSDAAVEAADVVIMNDEPSKIPLAIRTARNTMKIVRQNIGFALAVKFAVLILATAGMATMWMAVFADVGVEILVVLNAMRKK
ncbi:MAG: cadmium-translocating P-type ATPase [Clostridiales bacterium]|jgi:Cd2+/Zn2+-exporting ATPase|nr:cadmium-translocating P-type ATPase [Clostridiales bacterium]